VWQNFVTEEHNPIVIIRKKFVAQQLASISNAEAKGGQKFKDNRKEETCDSMGDSAVQDRYQPETV
jgi:hypothetical protein